MQLNVREAATVPVAGPRGYCGTRVVNVAPQPDQQLHLSLYGVVVCTLYGKVRSRTIAAGNGMEMK